MLYELGDCTNLALCTTHLDWQLRRDAQRMAHLGLSSPELAIY